MRAYWKPPPEPWTAALGGRPSGYIPPEAIPKKLASKIVSKLPSTTYKAVVYARPDLKFLDAIDAGQVLAVPSKTILDPYWHRWSGLNDRVLVCSRDAAAVVAARIELAPGYAARTFLRAESFLQFVVKAHGLRVDDLALRAQRVRADGAVASNDLCLEYCSPARRDVCRGDCRRLSPEPAPLAAWAAKQKVRDDAKRRAGTLRYGVPRADRVGIQ